MKEKNNSQGLFDMGVSPHYGIGGQELTDTGYRQRLTEQWGVQDIATGETDCLHGLLNEGKAKNLFIFGEDPLGCAIDPASVQKVLSHATFTVVQDYFITDTARLADLVLPASFPVESGGTYTNSGKVIQGFEQCLDSKTGKTSIQQLAGILNEFGISTPDNPREILMEIIALLPTEKVHGKLLMRPTKEDNNNRFYKHGCDSVGARFEAGFKV
jgi:predicted molibdopterin-dependent oxidoreductase YjgC